MAVNEKPTDGNLLDFETEMFLDIVSNDALVLAAKGLLFNEVIVNLLKVHCDPGNLVIVLNCSDYDVKYYLSRLPAKNVHNITYAASVKNRLELYLEGGVYFVTSRILVVDMCKENIPIDKITGFVVQRAHSVLGKGSEDWILRMFRQRNKTGFIKAFSNSAQACNRDVNDINRIMRCLYVKHLYMWPRFHTLLLPTLLQHAPQVIEYRVAMSPNMEKIQLSILELMNMIVREIKNQNPLVEMKEVTVENCLNKRCLKSIQSHLNVVWNQFSHKSTKLITELKTLSNLLSFMLDEDPVTFYATMIQYQKSEYVHTATWPLFKPAEELFAYVQNLVYTKGKEKELNPEPCFKWKPLLDLLTKELVPRLEADKNEQNKHILVLCKDAKICRQLSEILLVGTQHYLFTRALQRGIRFNSVNEAFGGKAAVGVEQRKAPLGCTAGKYTKDKQGTAMSSDATKELEECLDKSSYCLTMSQNHGEDESAFDLDVDEENQSFVFREEQIGCPVKPSTSRSAPEDDDDVVFVSGGEEIHDTTHDFKAKITIQAFKHEHSDLSLTKTLEDLQPKVLVMYNHDVAAVRQIEVYSARYACAELPVEIFTLQYVDSVEEQAYLTALRKEKVAFEELIEKKSKMVIPENQDGKCSEADVPDMNAVTAVNTRQGGGASTSRCETATKADRIVIVDMREFRSELPAEIHKQGITIKPLQMKVGDYILTPEIIVERKTVSDLIGSLQNGRLFDQCTNMFRYYARPILLIEFDATKPMSFEVYRDSRKDGDDFDIKKKLILLTMHFPRLMIMYCHGAASAAQYFAELKEGKEEPSDQQIANEDLRLKESKFNPVMYDFVSKLPGVTSKNVDAFMAKTRNLQQVLKMNKAQLEVVLGSGAEAEALRGAFHDDLNPQTVTKPLAKQRTKFKHLQGAKKSKPTTEGKD